MSKIKPTDCLSYANVVIQCGINDLRPGNANFDRAVDVNGLCNELQEKVNTISKLKGNINIFISPVLPCRVDKYNRRAIALNKLIRSNITDSNYRCTLLDVSTFCDRSYRTDSLDVSYSRGDAVHLNNRGTIKLATIIKNNIFLKYNSGKGSRINSNLSYADATRGVRRQQPSGRYPT